MGCLSLYISSFPEDESNINKTLLFVRCLSLYISFFSKDESNINKTLLWVTYRNILIRLDKTDTVFKESAEENNGGFDPRSMQLVFLRWSFYTVIPLLAFVGFLLLINRNFIYFSLISVTIIISIIIIIININIIIIVIFYSHYYYYYYH